MASIFMRLKESWDLTEEKIGGLNLLQRIWVLADSAWERFAHGANKVDYFQYGFYYKRRPCREQFVTIKKLRLFHHTCNDQEKRLIFAEKARFANEFRDYLGRDVLDMTSVSFQEFEAFAKTHDKMFLKPADGTYGRGVSIIECGLETDLRALYDSLAGRSILAEEVIHQHPAMAAFNESSLNSVRIVTLVRANGEPVILPGAAIRIGRKGRIADNFHHNGIAAQIDIETGIVCSTAIDKTGNRHVSHPDSGLPVIGFQIPMWSEVCKRVKQAALVYPEVRYVGWDVAVTNDNRVVLVEGNDRADPDLGQMSDGVGKWPIYKKYLDEIIALRK